MMFNHDDGDAGVDALKNHALSLAHTIVSPKPEWGKDVTLLLVDGKMYGLIGLHQGVWRISLKGLPETNDQFRQIFSDVIAGYHLNKVHWNTYVVDSQQYDQLFLEDRMLISYQLVVAKLSKKRRLALGL